MSEEPELVNTSTMRACKVVPFGIACYTLAVDGTRCVGTHVGVVGEPDEAQLWVNGDDSVPLIKVHGEG